MPTLKNFVGSRSWKKPTRRACQKPDQAVKNFWAIAKFSHRWKLMPDPAAEWEMNREPR